MSGNDTDVTQFLGELDAGIFEQKLAHLISQVALGTQLHGEGPKKGQIAIKLDFQRLNDDQVVITHSLAHKTPTSRGHTTEVDMNTTYMYVARGGKVTISPPKDNVYAQNTIEGEILEREQDGKKPSGKVHRLG